MAETRAARKTATESEPDDSGLFDAPTETVTIETETETDGGSGYGGDTPTPHEGDGDTEKKPKVSKRVHIGPRASAASFFTLLWSGAGTLLVRSQADVPVGRVLQFQAPLAGSKIDTLIQGTFLDALLQPFVQQADKIEGLGAIVAFPLLIGAYERNYETNPAVAQMIEPLLREVVQTTLVEMAPVIKKKAAAAKRAAQTMPEIRDMLNIDKDTDPIDAVLGTIFAPPDGAPPMQEDVE